MPVIATGARAAAGQAKRELFVEETSTVRVFGGGAIVRLREAVAPGQLVFLTNTANGREVVTQVAHKPEAPQKPGLVELCFTEEAPGFWEGPAVNPALAAAGMLPQPVDAPPSAVAVASVQLEAGQMQAPESALTRHTFDGIELEEIAPGEAEVQRLQQELEAAKRPILNSEPIPEKETEAAHVATPAATASATDLFSALLAVTASDREAKPAACADSQTAPAPSDLLTSLLAVAGEGNAQTGASFEQAAATAGGAELGSEANPPEASSPPTCVDAAEVETSIASERGAAATDESSPAAPPEEFAPGARDFTGETPYSQPKRDVTEEISKPGAGTSASGKIDRQKKSATAGKAAHLLPIAAILLAGLAGGAWLAGLPPFAKRAAVDDPTPIASSGAVSQPTAAPMAKQPAPAAAAGDSSTGLAAAEEASATENNLPAENNGPAMRPARLERKEYAKHADADSATDARTEGIAEPAPGGGPVLPAKLLRSVNPVYPAEAMRHFITGDITLEGRVEPSGRLSHIVVVSGPQALQSAAIEAFKQYKYRPAAQDGHPVSSTVSATIKFWFNP